MQLWMSCLHKYLLCECPAQEPSLWVRRHVPGFAIDSVVTILVFYSFSKVDSIQGAQFRESRFISGGLTEPILTSMTTIPLILKI